MRNRIYDAELTATKPANKLRAPIIIVLLAILVVGAFIYFGRNQNKPEKDIVDTDAPTYKVLHRDLDKNYPATPKSVVTFYCDILKVIYKEELTKDEYGLVVTQLRTMFDEELQAYNDYDSYYLSLQAEIDQYKNKNCYIADYSVEDGYGIEYKTLKDGKNYAFVEAKMYVRTGKNVQTVGEEFTLRKDDAGNWRLLTWKSVETSAME